MTGCSILYITLRLEIFMLLENELHVQILAMSPIPYDERIIQKYSVLAMRCINYNSRTCNNAGLNTKNFVNSILPLPNALLTSGIIGWLGWKTGTDRSIIVACYQ
jgi:hypothetical protein